MEVTLEELAEEIKKEDPREFVTIQIDDVYTLQLLKGTKAKYGSEGDTWLYFVTEDKSPCITVVFSANTEEYHTIFFSIIFYLHLQSYWELLKLI